MEDLHRPEPLRVVIAALSPNHLTDLDRAIGDEAALCTCTIGDLLNSVRNPVKTLGARTTNYERATECVKQDEEEIQRTD